MLITLNVVGFSNIFHSTHIHLAHDVRSDYMYSICTPIEMFIERSILNQNGKSFYEHSLPMFYVNFRYNSGTYGTLYYSIMSCYIWWLYDIRWSFVTNTVVRHNGHHAVTLICTMMIALMWSAITLFNHTIWGHDQSLLGDGELWSGLASVMINKSHTL